MHMLRVPAAQVEGKHGMTVLKNKMAKGGVPVLYHGALAASGATFVGHHSPSSALNSSLLFLADLEVVEVSHPSERRVN